MTKNIKNIAFDLGGVVIALSYEGAIRRFEEIGLKDARHHLDAFVQHGIFGDLESGRITSEEFRVGLSELGIHTLCPQNNEDWIPALCDYLKI